jgi:hypothetical protein
MSLDNSCNIKELKDLIYKFKTVRKRVIKYDFNATIMLARLPS